MFWLLIPSMTRHHTRCSRKGGPSHNQQQGRYWEVGGHSWINRFSTGGKKIGSAELATIWPPWSSSCAWLSRPACWPILQALSGHSLASEGCAVHGAALTPKTANPLITPESRFRWSPLSILRSSRPLPNCRLTVCNRRRFRKSPC